MKNSKVAVMQSQEPSKIVEQWRTRRTSALFSIYVCKQSWL